MTSVYDTQGHKSTSTASTRQYRSVDLDGKSFILSADVAVTSSLSQSQKDVWSCSLWKSFLTGGLRSDILSLTPKSFSVASVPAVPTGRLNPDVMYTNMTTVCGNETAVAILVDALLGNKDVTDLSCKNPSGDNTWTIKQCNVDGTEPTVCAGEGCTLAPDMCTASKAVNLVVNPCSSSNQGSGLSTLKVELRDVAPPPAIRKIHITKLERTQITLNVETFMEDKSLAVTGAQAICMTTTGTIQPTVRAEFLSANSFGTISSTATTAYGVSCTGEDSACFGNATVVLLNLVPSTEYNIFCLTQSVEGVQSQVSAALSATVTDSTKCCKKIYLKATSRQFFSGTAAELAFYQDVFEIYLDYLPKTSITVNIYANKTEEPVNMNNIITGVEKRDDLMFPVSHIWESTQNQNGIEVKTISIQSQTTNDIGTYIISVKGDKPGEFDDYAEIVDVSPISNFFTMNIIDLNAPLDPPKLVSAVYRSDGSQIIVSFDVATDRSQTEASFGSTSFAEFSKPSFSCNHLLVFEHSDSSLASCYFSSSLTVVIVPGGTDAHSTLLC